MDHQGNYKHTHAYKEIQYFDLKRLLQCVCGDIWALFVVKMITLIVIIQPYIVGQWYICLSPVCVVCFSNQQKGTKAPQAAGKIHTDFEKGFIMAEVMKYLDFKEEGSEPAVKVRSTASFILFYFLV